MTPLKYKQMLQAKKETPKPALKRTTTEFDFPQYVSAEPAKQTEERQVSLTLENQK